MTAIRTHHHRVGPERFEEFSARRAAVVVDRP